MQATQNVSVVRTAGQAESAPWPKIAMWTVLFQLAWFWEKLPGLVFQGAMPDTDDYQRLHSVRAFLDGQNWFDLTNYRMNPPAGADMHWSRLVDAPIAALISFLDVFVETALAERLTAIVWPLLLMVATVFVVLAICRRLEPDANPLLALFFSITCVTAMTEFMPGRLDHHAIQILGFCLMLLGLVCARTTWGPVLVGAAAAFSISIGLDAILMVVFMLAWLGLEWALGMDRHGRSIQQAGVSLAAATTLLYAVNISPSNWFAVRCDANSVFYFSAFMAISAGLFLLGQLSPLIDGRDNDRIAVRRFAAGMVVAAPLAAILLLTFPQCASGPYGAISTELVSRWLVNVSEARGLFTQLEHFPQMWFWALGYSVLMLAIGMVVVAKRAARQPAFVAVYATFAISVLASLVQYRAMRVGVFAAIPLAVVFVGMSWQWFSARFSAFPPARAIAQVAIVALLAQPVWLGASMLALPDAAAIASGREPGHAPSAADDPARAKWRLEKPDLHCNLESQHALLRQLPRGLVMSDINSGPIIVVHTAHDVVGGPYHRNERAILDMVDFFETDAAAARNIAERRGIDYVAFCEPLEGLEPGLEDHPALAVRIQRGNEPAWLDRVSAVGDRLHLFRVNRN